MNYKIAVFITLVCAVLVAVLSCRDPFNPPSTTLDLKYLVVDGFLNSEEGSCSITLSRSVPLSTADANPNEEKATVTLEDNDGNIFSLTEVSPGKYTITGLAVVPSRTYRLNIRTQGNVQYQSDFVTVTQTPVIDSITWGNERTGVPIYISTHDATNNTHYYYWTYHETWAYNAAFASTIEVKGDTIVTRKDDIYHCWRSDQSTEILIGTSNQLKQDVISNFILVNIPWTSPKFEIKYSILVQQRAITSDAYEYWEQLKKNTENIGTLFDPLPSSITGNISCLTDPAELALGYFSAGSVQQKRIFIKSNDINRTGRGGVITGYESCQLDTALLSSGIGGNLPVSGWYKGPALVGYYVAPPSCVDCRYGGGNTIKPDFWDE